MDPHKCAVNIRMLEIKRDRQRLSQPSKDELKFVSTLDVPRFPKEGCFLKGSQAFSVCPSCNSNMWTKMSVEKWQNNDRGNPKYWEKNLSQCYFVHQKS
jgi:hypothetical protein